MGWLARLFGLSPQAQSPTRPQPVARFGFKPDAYLSDLHREQDVLQAEIVCQLVLKNKYLVEEKKEELSAIINKPNSSDRVSDVHFRGGHLLTVDEKKRLGLNTRMKYTDQFISFFYEERLAEIEPKALLHCLRI